MIYYLFLKYNLNYNSNIISSYHAKLFSRKRVLIYIFHFSFEMLLRWKINNIIYILWFCFVTCGIFFANWIILACEVTCSQEIISKLLYAYGNQIKYESWRRNYCKQVKAKNIHRVIQWKFCTKIMAKGTL